MKYLTLASISLFLIIGCSSTPLPDRASARLQETANPTFPSDAARNGIEGFVQMSFDLSTDGEPTNIKVVKSVPKLIFDKAAIRALSKWRYAPKIVNGKAVMQKGLTVQLDFKLS
ncbi:energy transducer TonB [Psychrosphaera algicola]|uniref:Protein TonB n=1 Tax=Psychrosphaera algicola TaxID=3023714 RepID=A0ABT5FJ69_9GAMM|nr:energy transducer TonB [Psychrosphaera sp. G1-22]MDC2891234.1 energy transducer TonB [Psychrosphaera sp. G1-22]